MLLAIPHGSSITTLAVFFPFQTTLLLNIAWGCCVLLGYSRVDSDCKRNCSFCPFEYRLFFLSNWYCELPSHFAVLDPTEWAFWFFLPPCCRWYIVNQMRFLLSAQSVFALCEVSHEPQKILLFPCKSNCPGCCPCLFLSWSPGPLLCDSIPPALQKTRCVCLHITCHWLCYLIHEKKTSAYGKTTGLFCFYSFCWYFLDKYLQETLNHGKLVHDVKGVEAFLA